MKTNKTNAIQQLGRWGLMLSLTTIFNAAPSSAADPNPEYPDFYNAANANASRGIDWVQSISVSAPAYCSDIKGDTTVTFKAPGMTRIQALCWQQPTTDNPNPFGHDVNVAPDLKLDADGNGSFVFHADQFPNGPITLRIQTKDDAKKQDICELQLYNQGGVVWNQGIPKTDPPAAQGMKLAFSDDFDGPLSISPDGKDARYPSHKTGGGDFSGWPFSNPGGENKPFGQVGTFMRIHASKEPGTKGCTGIISSIRGDGNGVSATAPCYFECRFLAQSAPGTWPAFWTLTKGTIGMDPKSPDYKTVASKGCDELDVIEAYGGYGPRNPNAGGKYNISNHFWGQPEPAWAEVWGHPDPTKKGPDGKKLLPHWATVDTMELGGKSSWSTTFHTYGLLITTTETVCYFDDIEVLRHPTGALSKSQPSWFLINYAIGGISGWKIDLARYSNQSDMWVDYVRVYQGM